MTASAHEFQGSSDRTFGLVMAAFFTLVGAGPLVRGHQARWTPLGIAAAFALFALLWPSALRPLNILWMKFGLLLNRVTSPIIMAVLFFGVFMPFGLVMRALGKRPLALERDPAAASYWITRTKPAEPASPASPATMTRQF